MAPKEWCTDCIKRLHVYHQHRGDNKNTFQLCNQCVHRAIEERKHEIRARLRTIKIS